MNEPYQKPESSGPGLDEHIVFKVLAQGLRSCAAVGKFDVQYLPREFVYAPRGTKLFAFETLEHAQDFQRKNPRLSIWKATARGVSRAARTIGDSTHSVDMADFWTVQNRGKSFGSFEGFKSPPGTVWADAIRLDAEVLIISPASKSRFLRWGRSPSEGCPAPKEPSWRSDSLAVSEPFGMPSGFARSGPSTDYN